MSAGSKTRPLSRYIKDFKHSQMHCFQCKKTLDRMTLVFRGQVINKQAIAKLDQPVDDALWCDLSQELTALCRFCSEISYNCHSSYFDIMAFKQYLFEQTDMNHSTVREYVVRLRRLDEILLVHNCPIESIKEGDLEQLDIEALPIVGHENYRIALRKYGKYLSWQKNAQDDGIAE